MSPSIPRSLQNILSHQPELTKGIFYNHLTKRQLPEVGLLNPLLQFAAGIGFIRNVPPRLQNRQRFPAIVRPREDGGYEIVAGHRRKHGSELAGLQNLPCIVREMDDDTATILMVDSNIQRENILPSERAQAYKMKLEAIRRKAGRPAKTEETEKGVNCDQVGHNFDGKRSVEIIADEAGESKSQIQRYIRLTELSPELQQMVDEKKIGMTPAVEISYLKPEEQQMLLTAIDSEQATPSLSQAQRMKKLSRDGKLNDDTMLDIMMEQKKPEGYNVVLSADKLRKYFLRSYTPQRMEETILKLLDAWLRKRQREQSR